MKLEMNRIEQKCNSMCNKPIKHATILALAGLCGVLFLQTSSRADLVLPGYDLFTTVPTGTLFDGFNWAGVPLGTYNFGGSIGLQYVGATDTIMQRLGSSGNGQQVSLQLDALQLVSTTPIFGPGVYGYITLDPSYTSGGFVTEIPPEGVTINNDGTFTTSFDVYYDLHIGSLGGPIDTSGELDMTASGNWTQDLPLNALLIPGVNYLLDGTDTANDGWIPADQYGTMTLVPEPSSFALLGCGVLCLAIKTRRGRKQTHETR